MKTITKSKITLTALCISLFVLLLSGCHKKRISYVEMIRREDAEITDFMNKNGINTTDDFPEGLVTNEKTFVKVEDGLYIRVVKAGTKEPVDGVTIVRSRFNFESISPRVKLTQTLYGPLAGGTAPLPFVYYDQSERLELSPKASSDEAANSPLLCQALLKAAKLSGGDGAEVQMICSFRFGPSMMTKEGIPLFYSTVHFTFLN